MPPTLIAHADWATNSEKRWLSRSVRTPAGTYRAFAPEPVGPPDRSIERLLAHLPASGSLLIGFDFPIGLPAAYALRAGIEHFMPFLREAGRGRWSQFFDVAERPEEVSLERPFYPMRPGGARQAHLYQALGFDSIAPLRRRCERARPGRNAAAPLFWTLGANQVGKAAIAGWTRVLVPALADAALDAAVWPFDGPLDALVARHRVVIVETYPSEFYRHLGVSFAGSGRSDAAARARNADALLDFARAAGVDVADDLAREITTGFQSDDPFDAVVGLFGMLEVALGRRPPGDPADDEIQRIEGWILGQRDHSRG